MQNVLFISHNTHQCGIYQFGRNTIEVLQNSSKYKFFYVECSLENGHIELLNALQRHKPVAVIYNWHLSTLPWLTNQLFTQIDNYMPYLKHVMIPHGLDVCFPRVDAYISDDPDSFEDNKHFHIGRYIFDYTSQKMPAINTIGSFGFGDLHKGYLRLVEQVNKEFNEATIRLHIPCQSFGDKQGNNAQLIVEKCKKLAKPGIKIEASHNFLTKYELLDWLAENSINCFLFDKNTDVYGKGISSSIDYAFAVKRPIAITNSPMFRHVATAQPSILIEQMTLKEIIANGTRPLEQFYKRWTKENLLKDYERIIDAMVVSLKEKGASNYIKKELPHNLRSNRVLTVADRAQLSTVIEELKILSPDIMQRKLPQAVFQNAFIFQQAKFYAKKSDDIIVIGGYEDPIGPALQRLGYKITITDPNIDGKGMRNVWIESVYSGVKYDMVICCSVLEHVEDDVSFVQEMHQVLKPGGIALLTTDYRYDWTEHMPKPLVDCRLYTAQRLKFLMDNLPANSAIDEPQWDNIEPYFFYEEAKYCFVSFAFQKKLDHIIDDEANYSKRYVNQLARDLIVFQSIAQELQLKVNQFDELQKIKPTAIALAKKMSFISEKYPLLARVSKKILKNIKIILLKTQLIKES